MEEGTTTHVAELDSCLVVVRNVPCSRCAQCGAVTYTAAVARRLEAILDGLSNTLTEVAIVNYSDKVA
jgi:YgiT-type zinc finger domain-containing protein